MDAFEINKIVGALLASILFVVVLNFVGDALFEPDKLEKTVYFAAAPGEEQPAAEEAAATEEEEKPSDDEAAATGEETASTEAATPTGGEPPKPAADPMAALLAAAAPDKGRKLAKKCVACHTFDPGGRSKVGPNLYGVVGAQVAADEKYKYSNALKALDGAWGYAELNAYLTKPKAYAPGTKMSFPGFAKIEDRAAVIAFLRTLSESPLPLPGQ